MKYELPLLLYYPVEKRGFSMKLNFSAMGPVPRITISTKTSIYPVTPRTSYRFPIIFLRQSHKHAMLTEVAQVIPGRLAFLVRSA